MIIRKAYKFRLKTNDEIEHQFWLFAGHCRFLWNYFWHLNRNRLLNRQSIMRYGEMDFWSKQLKKSDEYDFLKEAPAHILQQKLKDLDKAYRDGFDKKQINKRLPTKRKRQLHSSFRFPESKHFKIENKRICLPKIGWVGLFKSREIEGTVKNITISYHGGHWYASIQVEQSIADPMIRKTEAVGIDLGVAKLATLSNGVVYHPRNSYRRLESNLAKEQRKLSRKKKFSKNWLKQKKKLQKLHSKIANTRKDYIHKITTEVCKNHAEIYVEDLKIANMSKSAKGTQEAHGKNVKAKSGLNKSILDQSWHQFRSQLEYKSHWHGGLIIAIDPKHTSQRCSKCDHIEKENRQTQEKFKCVSCGFSTNADINAACNILAAGRAVSVCEANHISGRQQKLRGTRKKVPA